MSVGSMVGSSGEVVAVLGRRVMDIMCIAVKREKWYKDLWKWREV